MESLAEQTVPVATVLGEPVHDLPVDLYIPPDALRVLLESFEGPLDLLLYLIRRQNIDILDIPMAVVTAQYMQYVEAMKSTRLELAAEYLLMAAVLIDIKSRMLLPKPPVDLDHEVEDPRAELVRRLLEYEQMKQAALALDAMPQAGRDFSWVTVWFERELEERLPEVSAVDLKQAWVQLLSRVKNHSHHTVKPDELSVREQMSRILGRLQGGGFVEFFDLFELQSGVPLLVVSFIAVLELVKESLIQITQNSAYDPIYVALKFEEEIAT